MRSGCGRAGLAILGCVLSLLSPFLASGTAYALDLSVDSTTDAIDAAPGDGVCATAPLPGEGVRCTLRAAIMEANATPDADGVSVPEGVYVLSIAGRDEPGAASGDLNITRGVSIAGAGADRTIVEANRIDRVFTVVGASDVSISKVTIRRGDAGGSGPGGGLAVGPGVSLTLSEVSVTDNTTLSAGGGIANVNYPRSALSIVNSAITGNSAGEGGGIANTGHLTLVNTTISGNTASLAGGGIKASGSEGSGSFAHVTIAANSAPPGEGGGMWKDRSAPPYLLINTIVANNTGGNCGNIGFPWPQEGRGNSIDSESTCNLNMPNVDPRLAPLAENGGSTRTHALLPGSPAIDAGYSGGPGGGCPSTDQRGAVRPYDGDGNGVADCDIGAYEFGAPVAFTLTVSKAGTGAGAVTSDTQHPGISCGSDCSESYTSGTQVALTADPDAGSTFAGWSGACTNSSGACTVTMDATRSTTATFTISPVVVPCQPTPIGPTGAVTVATPSFAWTAAPNANGYELLVRGRTGWVVQASATAASACSGVTCSVTPGTALPGGTYAWVVRATNAVGLSPWSAATYFWVGTAPPGQATLGGPSETIADTTPTYTWGAVADAAWYRLVVVNAGGSVVVDKWSPDVFLCNATGCAVTPPGTLEAGAYWWAVRT